MRSHSTSLFLLDKTVVSHNLSPSTLSREVGTPSSRPLPSSKPLHPINMTKRSSPLKPRKNNAKPSAKPSAAPLPRRYVSDQANREDCSAAIAEGIPLAAPPAAASAPAPAPVTPGAQLPAAIESGILPAAGRERAQLSGEAPLGDGSADASIEPPRAPAQAPPAPAPASAPPPAQAPASAPATRTGPSFYNW